MIRAEIRCPERILVVFSWKKEVKDLKRRSLKKILLELYFVFGPR
jgi:hypothetical protein